MKGTEEAQRVKSVFKLDKPEPSVPPRRWCVKSSSPAQNGQSTSLGLSVRQYEARSQQKTLLVYSLHTVIEGKERMNEGRDI